MREPPKLSTWMLETIVLQQCNKVKFPNLPNCYFMGLRKGSRNSAECPNLCMSERPRFPLHRPEWSKRLLFVSVTGMISPARGHGVDLLSGNEFFFQDCRKVSTSDLQSEVGEVFGEIGGELPAKFGRRFSGFFYWGKSSETFSTKTPPQISPSNFTTSFWVVAGPRKGKFPNPSWGGLSVCPSFGFPTISLQPWRPIPP